MTNDLTVRTATPDDAPALLAIYAPYVTDTAISWETEVPTVEEFRRRVARTLETYPYLVAERGGEIVGYCCTGPFVGRAAYRWSAETTIYLRPDCQKQGVGKALYAALECISKAQNVTNLYACIGVPVQADEHLTDNSADFHAHMGYRLVGRFEGCGWKFGRRYDMVWMEKRLSAPDEQPAPLIPFPELKQRSLV